MTEGVQSAGNVHRRECGTVVERRLSETVQVEPVHDHQAAGIDTPHQRVGSIGHIDGFVSGAVVDKTVLGIAGVVVSSGDRAGIGNVVGIGAHRGRRTDVGEIAAGIEKAVALVAGVNVGADDLSAGVDPYADGASVGGIGIVDVGGGVAGKHHAVSRVRGIGIPAH